MMAGRLRNLNEKGFSRLVELRLWCILKQMNHSASNKKYSSLKRERKIDMLLSVVFSIDRHPRETRPNKDLAGKIINKWARPIFNVRTDFSTMTKEERELRDLEMSAKLELKKRNRPKTQVVHVEENEPSGLKPGDPGWVGRARVPMVKNREYINRPDWQSHEDVSQTKKKTINLLEKHKRSFADRKKTTKSQHAVKISLEGKHMAL